MKRQRGQAAVEFALILPMFALFLFGMIYGGIMFLQFLNLSNDARAEARRIAIMSETARHSELGDPYATEANPYIPSRLNRWSSFYTVTRKIWVENNTDVVVQTEFERDNRDLPRILSTVGWPPQTFSMKYRMQLEKE